MPSDTALVRALETDLRPGVEDDSLVAQLEQHIEDYARLLDVSQDVLKFVTAKRDAALPAWVRDRLEQGRSRRQNDHRVAASARTQAVAQKLGEMAVFTNGSTYVDVGLLFDLTADTAVRYFAFDIGGPHAVIVSRMMLLELARRVRFKDRRAWFDERGLHLRWRDGRGGLDLRSDAIPSRVLATANILVVTLRPQPANETTPAPAPLATPSRRRSWLGEALSDLALA